MPHDLESPFRLDPDVLTSNLGPLLTRCAALLERRGRVQLAKVGLSPLQADVLHLLEGVRPGQDQRAIDIARALRLNPIVVARHMRLFEARGWLIALTGRGRWAIDAPSSHREGLEKDKEAALARFEPDQSFFEPLGLEQRGSRGS